MTKASDNEFPSVLFDQQGSDPSTPGADLWRLYFKSGGLYHISDTGAVVGPLAASAGAIPEVPIMTIPEISDIDGNGAVGPGANNRAIYMRLECWTSRTVSTAHFYVGTASGNMDIGIYSSDLATLHASTGSFAMPAAGQRSQALTGSFAMVAGTVYYIGVSMSSSSARLAGKVGGMTTQVATGGWNVMGHSDSGHPLASGPTVTWEGQRGKVFVALR